MTHPILRSVALAAFGALGLLAALPHGGPAAAGESATEPPLPTIIPANDEERKAAIDAVAAAQLEKSNEKLTAAVALMQERRHADFVPIIRVHVGHDDPKVQAAAIVAAASHELKDLEKLIRKTLRAKPKKSNAPAGTGAVAAACADYLARMEISGEQEFVLKEQLQPLIKDERRIKLSWARDLVRSSIHYLGKTKYKPAVPYMVEELLPEPFPKDVNDGNNPPAAYWEARTKLWHDYEGWTRWALKEITGKEFRTAREWQAWVKQQDKKEFK